ncbi:hypothetical protein GCM10022215_29910 [Nocardioides fonticola]|uniref:DUF222 domain-containing protein n=1 Tax=Nocardioides fonticola TaxID=450363 RepID=A0ABP7XQR8_9ACTN
MSADLLREAAAVLRELAADADDGRPWKSEGSFVDTDPECGFDAGTSRLSAYIATMHPGVGLALADWLELAATAEELVQTFDERPIPTTSAQLRVARGILGRDS